MLPNENGSLLYLLFLMPSVAVCISASENNRTLPGRSGAAEHIAAEMGGKSARTKMNYWITNSAFSVCVCVVGIASKELETQRFCRVPAIWAF